MTRNRDQLRRTATAGAAFALLGIIEAGPAAANNAEAWQAREVAGTVRRLPQGGQWMAVTAGDRIAAGEQVETDTSGRVVLGRGADAITVAPGSKLALPSETEAGATVLQSFGTALFKVERGPQRRFEVRTPYMAAVVKGTTFTVTASPIASTVHVVEGAVEVGSLGNGQKIMVRPGQTATMPSKRDAGVSLISVQRSEQAPVQPVGGGERSSTGAAASTPAGARLGAGNVGEGRGLTKPLGEMELDVSAATKGLVSRSAAAPEVARGKPQNEQSVRSGLTGARDQKVIDRTLRGEDGAKLTKVNDAKADHPSKDKLDNLLKDKLDSPAKDKLDNPAKDKLDNPAKDKLDHPSKDKLDNPAKDKLDNPSKDKLDNPAKDKLDKPAKDKLDNPSKDKPSVDRTPTDKPGTEKPKNKKG